MSSLKDRLGGKVYDFIPPFGGENIPTLKELSQEQEKAAVLAAITDTAKEIIAAANRIINAQDPTSSIVIKHRLESLQSAIKGKFTSITAIQNLTQELNEEVVRLTSTH